MYAQLSDVRLEHILGSDAGALRFEGKPKEPTLKARMKEFVGYKPPFDRHDWVVDRCGAEVRYLIDYYNGRPVAGTSKPVSMYIDARPAGDTLTDVWDRLRRPFVQIARGVRGPATAVAADSFRQSAERARSPPAAGSGEP